MRREVGEVPNVKWSHSAACRDNPYVTTEQFFLDPPKRPSRVSKTTNILYEQAREVCLTECPVRKECLYDAMSWESGLAGSIRYGLFGGLDPAERAALDKNRKFLTFEEVSYGD